MYKTSMSLNLETLTQCAPKIVQAQPVAEVLLALGSNYDAKKYLPLARERLAALGAVQLSTAFKNPDFTATTAQPKPDYTNQCVHLALTTPMSLQQLQQTLKALEGDCHRCRQTEPDQIRRVTMDIDILLVKLEQEKNSLSNIMLADWMVMADRYPFKAHEMAGIEELEIIRL